MKKSVWIILSTIVLILLIIAFFIWKSQQEVKPDIEKSEKPIEYIAGKVKRCAINPVFPLKQGLQPPLLIDLRQQGYRGLRIIENRVDGKILMRDQWSEFGWLGLYTLDNRGNIYLSSVPHESILHNPVGEQNRVLILDSQNGELTQFMELPQKQESTIRNPFGAMGLHYDCDNGFLYVSSLAGSTMKEELGSIFQIDIQKKEIVSRLEDVDAIGLSTYNTSEGKRLYYGLAREPEVYSIALDEEGKFNGEPRMEFSLLDQPGGAFDKAHRIRFIQNDVMEVKANNFTFTLAAASDPERNIYRFRYDRNSDKWNFLDVHQQQQQQNN
jgi:hypothetical protein